MRPGGPNLHVVHEDMMFAPWHRPLLTSALAVAVLAPPASAQVGIPPELAALNDTLQAARDAFSAAYVAGEFERLAAMYTEDAILLPGGGLIRGREAIQRFFTYGPGRTQVAHSMLPTSLTLEGNTAVETGAWSSTVSRDGGPARTASGRHMLVWRRQPDGRWLLTHDAWHQAPARPPEPRRVEGGTPAASRRPSHPAFDRRTAGLLLVPQDPAAPVYLESPDGMWAIVVVTDDTPGGGDDDLFLARRTSTGWTPLEHVPEPINSASHDYAPSLSDDGRFLLFTSDRDGEPALYRIALPALGLDPVSTSTPGSGSASR